MDNQDSISSLSKFAQLPLSLTWIDNIMRPFAGLEHIMRLHDIGKSFAAPALLDKTVLSTFRTSLAGQHSFKIGADLVAIATQARGIHHAFKTVGFAESAEHIRAVQSVASDFGKKVAASYPSSLFDGMKEVSTAFNKFPIADLFPPQYITSLQAFKFPSEVIDRLSQFSSLQNSFFQKGGFRAFADVSLLTNAWLGQNATLQSTLNGFYEDLAKAAAQEGAWEDLGMGADMGESALTFIESFASQVAVTKEQLDAILLWVQRMLMLLVVFPATRPNNLTKVLVFWIGAISGAAGLYDFAGKVMHPSEEVATKKDVQQLSQKLKESLVVTNQTNTSEGALYQVVIATKVYLKATQHTQIIKKLNVGKVVRCLRKKGKWLYVGFHDEDHDPIQGWILKKDLTSVEI